jgi:FkbM family methyltransferase
MAPAMSPRDFVEALYRVCLDRAADPTGLAAWTAAMEAQGDATVVLAGLLASDEFRRHGEKPDARHRAHLTATARDALGRRPRVVDVGAQSLGARSHAYSSLFDATAVDVVGFDPLAARLTERAEREDHDGNLSLLPFALGDGAEHTLYVNNDDATSSLFPLNAAHNARFDHLSSLRTVHTERVRTRRLDDVLAPGPVDFLKLDVQGAELMVLQGGPATTAAAAVVHCEVEFAPIYEGQPLFPDVQRELAIHGFELVDLLVDSRYRYLTASAESSPDRLLWADAVYFRATNTPETLVAQALIAAAVYGKPTFAEHLLDRAGVAWS